MRKGLYLLLILLTFSISYSFAGNGIGLGKERSSIIKKKKKGGFDKSKLFFGGALGGGGTPGGFAFNVAPSVGYMITDRFHAGFNIGYLHARQKRFYNDNSYDLIKSNMYSAALFARYFVFESVFIQVRPEINLLRDKVQAFDNQGVQFDEQPFSYNIPSALVGAGYAQRIGGNSYGFFSVSYDLVQNPNSPYFRQPVFGGGFALGIFGMR